MALVSRMKFAPRAQGKVACPSEPTREMVSAEPAGLGETQLLEPGARLRNCAVRTLLKRDCLVEGQSDRMTEADCASGPANAAEREEFGIMSLSLK